MKAIERQEVSEKSRDWSMRTFSTAIIAAQWESLFDSISPTDWSSISLTPALKNPDFPIPQMSGDEEWVTELYNNILLVDPDPDGLKHWLNAMKQGISREQIYQYFVNIAQSDNAKSQPAPDLSTLFDGKTDDPNRRKRTLLVMKESGGDIFIVTSLFPGIKRLYPDADLYVACDPKYADILADNPNVYRVIPYMPQMENELHMRNFVEHYYFPALATQKQLAYLTLDRIELDLEAVEAVEAVEKVTTT